MENTQKGFIGLIMLLLGVAIMAFLIVRTDLFSRSEGSKSILEISTDAVGEAKEVKMLIENNSRKASEY